MIFSGYLILTMKGNTSCNFGTQEFGKNGASILAKENISDRKELFLEYPQMTVRDKRKKNNRLFSGIFF